MKKCFELIIEGRVQGVGFRYFAFNNALKHNITGYVKNLPDGNVEIVCSGEKQDLDKFISKMKKGPSFSYISSFKINELSSDGYEFKNFEIRY
ncbi:MAG: acylphosphatase [Actinobacteria bacterium]|nr:acylphosphatase [Actinomycetota bacterium]